MSDTEEDDPDEKTIAEDLVVTKYKLAGDIANRVLKQVVSKCVEGVSVRENCILSDRLIVEETSKVFKKEKELKKGIAFPTSISVNNCICHFSPLENDPDYTLQDEDVVKIDLGVHIDGFIALVAHTIVIGASRERKITGRKADVILAAHFASLIALRLLKPGEGNFTITDYIQKVAEIFNCKPVEGMLSHQLRQFKVDGKKAIIQNPNETGKKEFDKHQFSMHEVYALDVLLSTGEGIGKETGTRVSMYKKTDENYQLKLRTSRTIYSEVNHKYGNMPFSLRSFEDEKKARLGLTECISHGLIEPFRVLYERPNEFVAQFKFTVLLMPNGSHKITGLPFESDYYKSEFEISDKDLRAILNSSSNPKSIKKKKRKKMRRFGDYEAEGDEVD